MTRRGKSDAEAPQTRTTKIPARFVTGVREVEKLFSESAEQSIVSA
jgi:hypothetical protein